jgi:aquaporin Z
MSANLPTPETPNRDDDVVEIVDPNADDDLYEITIPEGPTLLARAAIEAFGTFALVLVTLATALYLPLFGVDPLGAVLAPGLVLVGLMFAFGHISGGHFNPAVTLGAALAGRVEWLDAALYWAAQVVAAIVAGLILWATLPSELPGLLGVEGARGLMDNAANGWDEQAPLSVLAGGQVTFDWRAALIFETVAVAILVAVWLGSTLRGSSRGGAPFAVGLTYGALLMLTAAITGGSLNPARSTGVALWAEGAAIGQLWLFWLAPLLGAAIAGLVYVAFGPSTAEAVEVVEFDDDEDADDDDTRL